MLADAHQRAAVSSRMMVMTTVPCSHESDRVIRCSNAPSDVRMAAVRSIIVKIFDFPRHAASSLFLPNKRDYELPRLKVGNRAADPSPYDTGTSYCHP